ncbi:aspartyl-phosphate phosphatase Spo0E family protein [Lentibacillus sp.]|uniref:aspartyl-phosphate phosphatase Spo0E family protein n=1 Tax=Lentibacillus sp. TaxID=1925746 RepID=UPI002B4B83C2|nr:aspartyl-phosphate phosphatase Spo0E family protein [Lentibacillus sp.]HLS09591.1 aspartyl-phosphate phosphatase Spo0E family protein [Lentibacillus sp.]
MANHSIFLEKIEAYRQEMLAISKQYELTSPTVVESSRRLDELLNEYQDAERFKSI